MSKRMCGKVSRSGRCLALAVVSAALVPAFTPASAGAGELVARPFVGDSPISDRGAAARVRRSPWEPRPSNLLANQRVPTAPELAHFRAKSEMPNRHLITGNFRGTTDEIIQWAAIKWGFHPELFRAVAAAESWWKMSFVGDNGDSLGIFQIRKPYHCCHPLAARSTAFNADYYGGILRAYYDGKQAWLNTVERARDYRAGDLWGSVGSWASGRWYLGKAPWYIGLVQDRLRERPWLAEHF